MKWWQTGLLNWNVNFRNCGGTYWHALFGGCLAILTIVAAVNTDVHLILMVEAIKILVRRTLGELCAGRQKS